MRTLSLSVSALLGCAGVVVAADPSIKFIFGLVAVCCIMLAVGVNTVKSNNRSRVNV